MNHLTSFQVFKNQSKMQTTLKVLVFGLSFLIINSCIDDPIKTQDTPINKMLPLGASRVEGFRPHFESYRYELWKDLTENGWTFDFIGTRSDKASYPLYNGKKFDIDHG